MFLFTFLIIFVNRIVVSNQFTNHASCGQTTRNFVIGGEDAEDGEFSFMVSLQLNRTHFCGASVLNDRWVITASHCIDMFRNKWKRVSDFKMVMGSVNQTQGKKEYSVQAIVAHGCYFKYSSIDIDADIALLLSNETIDIDNKHIGTICLPPKDKMPVKRAMQVAGWGVWDPDREIASDMLQKMSAEVLDESYCQHYVFFRNLGFTIGPRWNLGQRLCIRSVDSTPCRGDSGGPLFQRVNGRYYNMGIASFIAIRMVPLPGSNKCYKSNPALYTRTSFYRQWIDQVISNQSIRDFVISDCDQ